METKEQKESLKRYLQDTVTWEVDKINSLKRSHLVAWCLAIAGLSIGGICAWAVGQLSPLKTVVPYVIRVNETSGTVDIIKASTLIEKYPLLLKKMDPPAGGL